MKAVFLPFTLFEKHYQFEKIFQIKGAIYVLKRKNFSFSRQRKIRSKKFYTFSTKMYPRLFLLLFTTFLTFSCGIPQKEKKTYMQQFNDVPTSIIIEDLQLELEATVWFNLMPTMGEQKGTPLISSILLRAKGNKELPKSLRLEKQYFIQGKQVWEKEFSEIEQTNALYIEGIIRVNDIALDDEIPVLLICEFSCKGNSYKIASQKQKITHTY